MSGMICKGTLTPIDMGQASGSSWARSGPQTVFLNKVLLECTHVPICLHMVYGLDLHYNSRVDHYDRYSMAHKT